MYISVDMVDANSLKDRIDTIVNNVPIDEQIDDVDNSVDNSNFDIKPEEVEAAQKAAVEKAAADREREAIGAEPKDSFEPPKSMKSILRENLSQKIADMATVDNVLACFDEDSLNKMEAIHLTTEGRKLQAEVLSRLIVDNRNRDAEVPSINIATRDNILAPKLGSIGSEEARKEYYEVLKSLGQGFIDVFERMPASVQAQCILQRYQERLAGRVTTSTPKAPLSQEELRARSERDAKVTEICEATGLSREQYINLRKGLGLKD